MRVLMSKLKVLDLFSGIGGFSLGLERTGGFETIAFCEVNEFCSKVLKKHWPTIQNLGDITKIGIQPISSVVDSPVRTLVTQANAPDLPAAVPVSGHGYAVPFAWFDQSTQSWRTWQRCWEMGWALYSETWPRSGMTRNGIAYQLPTLVQSMKGIESGLLPTLTLNGNYNRKGASKSSGDGLITVLKRMLPTLTAHDWRGGAKPERTERMWETSRRGCDLPSALRILYPDTTGSINPSWAEGYMGYPIGWTELNHSETQ